MSASHSPSATPSSSAWRLWLMLLVSGVVLLAHGPLLIMLGERMWVTDHYSFFPLIIVGATVLGWQRYHRYIEQNSEDIWDAGFRSPVLWLSAIVLLGLGVAAHSPWPAGVAFLLALRASINSLLVEQLARRLMPAWWFLWLAIPLPFNFDRHLILAMQLLATKLASGVLDLAEVRHSVSGVVLELPQKSFFVEEACSGIQSLFAAISVTVFYSMLGRRGLWRTLLLTICGVGWVVAANALRIITVAIASVRYELPIDEGWAHEATGAAVFVLAMLMIVSTDRFLLFLSPLKVRGAFEQDRSKSHSSHSHRRGGTSAWTVPAAVVFLALFAVLGFVQMTRAVPYDIANPYVGIGEEIVNETSLPEEWNGWKRSDYSVIQREPDDPTGQLSHIWQFERSGQTVLFSVDGPFDNWHDLGMCYSVMGWTVGREDDHYRETDGRRRYHFSDLTQEKPDGRHAFVAFTSFNEYGRNVPPPPFFRAGVGIRFPNASLLVNEMLQTVTPTDQDREESATVFQTQAFVEAGSLLTSAERRSILQLFHEFTGQVKAHLADASTDNSTDDRSTEEIE